MGVGRGDERHLDAPDELPHLRVDPVTHLLAVEPVGTFFRAAYQDPAGLFWELGFVNDAVGTRGATRTTMRCWQPVVRTPTPAGELAVARIAPGPALRRGDPELDAVLEAFGLDPWPRCRCTRPRRWALWTPSLANPRTYELHGILLKASEPILRPPRVAFGLASVGGVLLASVVADASGFRATPGLVGSAGSEWWFHTNWACRIPRFSVDGSSRVGRTSVIWPSLGVPVPPRRLLTRRSRSRQDLIEALGWRNRGR